MTTRTTTIAVHAHSSRHRSDTRPWYRQFWPWFLLALPALSVAVSFAMLYQALHGADPVLPHEGDSTSYSAPRGPVAAQRAETNASGRTP
jgi:uncharacterized protein